MLTILLTVTDVVDVTGLEKNWIWTLFAGEYSWKLLGAVSTDGVRLFFLFTKYVKNVTLVQSHKKCIYSCSQSLWSMGSLHCRLLVIMVAMLTRGDRLVELKVTMLNITLDVGKYS